MHAYLITGKTQEKRFYKAKEVLEECGATEIIELPAPKTKHFIKDIRRLNHRLSLKSGDNTKPRGVILEDAHLLTTEAANSFLKTLEEPPGNTIIILTAPNTDLVLGTISSRCTNMELGISNYELGKDGERKAEEVLQKLLKAGVGERLKFVEAIGTRQLALEFCIGQIYAVRKFLLNSITSQTENKGYTDTYGCIPPTLVELLERLERTRQDIEGNVNVKLTVGDLLLNYPSTL